jgi:hypothetical protein
MNNTDIGVGVTGLPRGNHNPSNLKPAHLVYVVDNYDKRDNLKIRYLLTLDKPTMEVPYLLAKGYFIEKTEEEIHASFNEILATEKKESMIEIYLPWHRVFQVKSLIFKSSQKK